jgi:molybdate transport system substrate-binding protein
MKLRRSASAVLLIFAVAACSGASTPAPSVPPASSGGAASTAPAALTVYAAASLKAALAKVTAAYQAANPGTTITVSADSSAALETKIEQGAPVDVFLSADTSNPQKLVDKGLATGPVVRFAGNLLTIIVPASNPAGIRTPADLARSGVKVIGAGDAVPITKYASQLVASLAAQPGYPPDFAAAYAANVVSKEDNVAAVVAKVELDEGDAGIVYVTDAKAATKVATIPVPTDANVPATYGGAVVKASPNQVAATRFLAWLAGPDGQAILASLGFLPPGT